WLTALPATVPSGRISRTLLGPDSHARELSVAASGSRHGEQHIDREDDDRSRRSDHKRHRLSGGEGAGRLTQCELGGPREARNEYAEEGGDQHECGRHLDGNPSVAAWMEASAESQQGARDDR